MAVAWSGKTQPAAAWIRARAAPSAPASNLTGPTSAPASGPPANPALPAAVRTTATVPSDCGVTVSVHFPPSSTLNAVTDPSWPVRSERSGHGGSPLARASEDVQTSPPTTQSPCSNALTTERAMSGAPTAGAANRNSAAKRATAAMYSSVA